MKEYNIVIKNTDSTVVAEYVSEYKTARHYQSEAELEKDFIERLIKQGYEYLDCRTPRQQDATPLQEGNFSGDVLVTNLRKQLEKLNDYTFTDNEWNTFFTTVIANPNESNEQKTEKIQEGYSAQTLVTNNGETKNIYLIDKQHIHNNSLQVINQYEVIAEHPHPTLSEGEGSIVRKNRYDVTILVNGLPMVHVELKRRGVAIREAFNQIKRYERDSFWAGTGLYQFIQIFVISNGTNTKYYSNTTREQSIKDNQTLANKGSKKTSNSFEFTSFWADANNKTIPDLIDFTQTFLVKNTLLNIITKYCVFTFDKDLLVMRPYQIVACERILGRIKKSHNLKQWGKVEAGGYIWHTTGSGKTLTSFKTAQLATRVEGVDKVLFIVDRKDLDYQTMKEYDKFEKGAANGNTSTKELIKQLENLATKIIITTIQKLGVFIKQKPTHPVFTKHLVLIFDECHRSQFGEMHQSITKSFKKYHIFGFTGTPIFADNMSSQGNPHLRTTEQAFGEKLHTYTIVDAISDKNVLPFKIDYLNTMQMGTDIKDAKVKAINEKEALESPERIAMNVKYILEHFETKTYRNQHKSHFKHRVITNTDEVAKSRNKSVVETKAMQRVNGFNSIFAVSSIDMAKAYYTEFKKQLSTTPSPFQLGGEFKVVTIFSYSANEEDADEEFNNDALNQNDRDFLESAIKDYNKMFKTTWDTSADNFQSYYKDVSMRMKNRQIDLMIVVNMFLTGFDATTLNTLWVDKNLKKHGLIQAFSRTNRILNSIKQYGNIICFRDLEDATNDAIALFGNKEAKGTVLIKTYDEYFNGYEDDGKHIDGYKELVEKLHIQNPLDDFETSVFGEDAEKQFIRLFGHILKLKNILSSFDDFAGNEQFCEQELQNYMSHYNDLYIKYKKLSEMEKVSILDDIVFEIELIKQIEVNIDYILALVWKYFKSKCKDKEILKTIDIAIGSSMELRSKKDLIEGFIARMNVSQDIDNDWTDYVRAEKEKDLNDIIEEEKLVKDKCIRFMEYSLQEGELKTSGTAINGFLGNVSRFNKTADGYGEKKQRVIDKLMALFEKYVGIYNKGE